MQGIRSVVHRIGWLSVTIHKWVKAVAVQGISRSPERCPRGY